jgi:hypothetical protein
MNVNDRSTVCPICGYEFPRKNIGLIIVAIVLLIVTVVYFIFKN